MTKIFRKRCLLHEILEEKKMTRTQLCDLTGLSNTQISDYIGNRKGMSLKNAILISYYLKCRVEDLYEWVIKTSLQD